MKAQAQQKLNALKQQVEKKMELTEEQWRQRWDDMSLKVKKNTDRGMSILNGLVGDLLEEKGLPIAVQMAFFHQRHPLTMNREALSKAYPKATGKICILVHGLSCTESVWDYRDDRETNYATQLAEAFGYTPMYVRYNTGLHISHNGQMLSQLMNVLMAQYPADIEEIIFITHSMGGLVTRSACSYGVEQKNGWTDKVRQLYFLGSPHMGADLEKFGNVVAKALQKSPLPYTRFIGEVFNRRSSGIKDLRFGYVRDEEWQGKDPGDMTSNKQTVPLLEGAEHFVITGTVHEDSEHILNEFFGDLLVRKHSATGGDEDNPHRLPFKPENHKEFLKVNHLRLAHNEQVYEQIKAWVGG